MDYLVNIKVNLSVFNWKALIVYIEGGDQETF